MIAVSLFAGRLALFVPLLGEAAHSLTEIIITAVASVAGTVLAAGLPLLMQNKGLRRRLKEAPAVSRGLAIGYFYNFLRPIGGFLNEAALEVRFPADEKRIPPVDGSGDRIRKFSAKEVEIILIVPKRLCMNVRGRWAPDIALN